MTWIGETREDAAEGPLKEAYARIARALGRVIPFYRAFSVSPRHLDAHLDFYGAVGAPSALSKTRKELIAVAVSADNGCRHCTALHAGFLARLSVDAGLIAALAADPERAVEHPALAAGDRAILRYALKLTRAPRAMTAADVGALRAAGLTEPEVFETALLTAYFNYTNRVAEGLGVEPE
jgi:uncharacterized peroxidase-related enzyme